MNLAGAIAVQHTGYDKSTLRTGIVHLGYGAFHRAHQAVFLDDYIEATDDHAWGIAAVNLRGSESTTFAAGQGKPDGYLLKTMAPDGQTRMRMVRSHIRFLDWTVARAETEAVLASEDVNAVTITVTESGYALASDWSLNLDDPLISAEIDGGTPASVYGFLARALDQRRQAGGAPITILCCDNIRENGRVLERAFLSYLEASGRSDLAAWVRSSTSFPCSMVDRITPRATPELAEEIERLLPGQGTNAIHAEAFTQWVIEDRFAGPMPDLGRVGVEIVSDVHPYEEAKIRILNGGHTALAYLGALAGHQTFDQAMADPALRAHFDQWERDEVLPGLSLDLPFDADAYLGQIAQRFGNAAIADQLERICMDGYSKMPVFIRPTIRACLAQGRDVSAGFRSIASWYVFARRAANGDSPFPYHEPFWSELAPLLAPGQQQAFARASRIWGDLPELYPGFVPGVMNALQEMERTWPV
ncbi:MAG: mannitol dehydrogenase family protein [Pseudomonadota bacterium]